MSSTAEAQGQPRRTVYTEPSTTTAEQPWPAFRYYAEGDRERFFGRSREVAGLMARVTGGLATAVYGPSGAGKTSLLLAGLFPELRRCALLPALWRFHPSTLERGLQPFLAQGLGELSQAGAVEPPVRTESSFSLWDWLHDENRRYWLGSRRASAIVLVFDQLEFVLRAATGGDPAARRFMSELLALATGRIPPWVAEAVAAGEPGSGVGLLRRSSSYHLVFAMTEEALGELLALSSEAPTFAPALFRVGGISGCEAMNVVLQRASTGDPPGGPVRDEAVAEQIVRVAASASSRELARSAPLEELIVRPAPLSVLCFQLNSQRVQDEDELIRPETIPRDLEAIVSRFYHETMARCSPQGQKYLEEALVNERGERNDVDQEEALEKGFTAEDLEHLLAKRILHQFPGRFKRPRLELSHDVLTDVVVRNREIRRQEIQLAARQAEERRKRKRQLAVVGAVLFVAFTAYLAWSLLELRSTNRDLKESNTALNEANSTLQTQNETILDLSQQLEEDHQVRDAKRLKSLTSIHHVFRSDTAPPHASRDRLRLALQALQTRRQSYEDFRTGVQVPIFGQALFEKRLRDALYPEFFKSELFPGSRSAEQTAGLGPLRAVAFSPDGRYLAAGGSAHERERGSGYIILLHQEDGTLLAERSTSFVVRDLAFDPSSSLLAAGGERNSLAVYRLDEKESGFVREKPDIERVDSTYRAEATGESSVNAIRTLAWREPGTILTGSKDGRLRRWPVRPRGTLSRPTALPHLGIGQIMSMAHSADGVLEVVAGSKGSIAFSIRGEHTHVRDLVALASKQIGAAEKGEGGDDGAVRAVAITELETPAAADAVMSSSVLRPNSSWLVVAGLETGGPLDYGSGGKLLLAHLSEAGCAGLHSSADCLRVRDAVDLGAPARTVVVQDDGKTVVVGLTSGQIRRWKIVAERELIAIDDLGCEGSCSTAPHQGWTFMAAHEAGTGNLATVGVDGRLLHWQRPPQQTWQSPYGGLSDLLVLPGSGQLVAAGQEQIVRLDQTRQLGASSGSPRFTRVTTRSLAPDGAGAILSLYRDGRLRKWSSSGERTPLETPTREGLALGTFAGDLILVTPAGLYRCAGLNCGESSPIAWPEKVPEMVSGTDEKCVAGGGGTGWNHASIASRDGGLAVGMAGAKCGALVVGDGPDHLRAFDLGACTPLGGGEAGGHDMRTIRVLSVAFAGRALVAGDSTGRIYHIPDLASDECTAYDGRLFGGAQALATTGEGLLASGHENGTVSLWFEDEKGFSSFLPLQEHDAAVTALAFSEDGERLYAAGGDGRITTWEVGDALLRRACERLGAAELALCDEVMAGTAPVLAER